MPMANAIHWERIACPLCRASAEEPFLQAPAEPDETIYHLVRCRECGMVYMNPRPDEVSIGAFYPDDYEAYRQALHPAAGWWRQRRGCLEKLALRRLGYPPPLLGAWEKTVAWLLAPWFGPDRHSQTALPYVGQGRLLDYGCGAGSFAVQMRRRGWTVMGMDFSASRRGRGPPAA